MFTLLSPGWLNMASKVDACVWNLSLNYSQILMSSSPLMALFLRVGEF